MKGFIKVDRSLAESPIWLSDTFSRGQAWLDLLMFANYKDGFFYVRGTKINVLRGQCAMSQITMGQRWKWSRGKVRRFLKDLENEGMIVQQTVQQTTIVSICNYNKYQEYEPADGTTERTANGQQTVHIQEGKEEKKAGRFKKPSLSELSDYFIENKYPPKQANSIASEFLEKYEDNGWRVGKQNKRMSSWKGTARQWMKYRPPEQHRPTIAELRAAGEL